MSEVPLLSSFVAVKHVPLLNTFSSANSKTLSESTLKSYFGMKKKKKKKKEKKRKRETILFDSEKKRKSVAVKATVQLNESKGLSVMNFSECLSLVDNSSR